MPEGGYRFPEIYVTQEEVIQAMRNVKQGKGAGVDGVSAELFKLHKRCYSKEEDDGGWCALCQKKIEFCMSLTKAEYWNGDGKNMNHLVGRLVALNKKYPKTPKLEEYRPIIVLSPVFKFL